jgi:hypothetical protein
VKAMTDDKVASGYRLWRAKAAWDGLEGFEHDLIVNIVVVLFLR